MTPKNQRRRRRRKKCPFCCEPFFPSLKMKDRQWACTRPGCQRKRQQENQRDWVAKNPGYYRGRYEDTKLWLKNHPGYLRNWRLKRRDIQDSVIDDSPYFTARYKELKSVIYKSPWTEAAYLVFYPP